MSQTFTIIAIVGFSLAVVLIVVAVAMFFKLNIKQVRDDLTGKTATRSIAEIRARTKSRKRISTEAGKKLGWDSSEPIKVPSGPLKTYATGVSTADMHDEEAATTLLSLTYEGEEETTILGGLADSDGESATTFLFNESDDEGATTVLSYDDSGEEETTLLGSSSSIEGEVQASVRS